MAKTPLLRALREPGNRRTSSRGQKVWEDFLGRSEELAVGRRTGGFWPSISQPAKFQRGSELTRLPLLPRVTTRFRHTIFLPFRLDTYAWYGG